MKESSCEIQQDDLGLEIRSILLLDDDVELTDALKQLLESRNFIVTTVRNGVEGLREVMAMDFDVIMCDMLMPTMPGDMFYLAVQRTRPHLCKRFIFVTAYEGNPKVDEFVRKVNGVVLMKPVQMQDLISMVSYVIQQNSKPAPSA